MKIVAILGLILIGCSAEGSGRHDYEVTADTRADTMIPELETEPVPEQMTPEPEQIEAQKASPLTMYVTPEPGNTDLLELTLRTIERVQLRTGAKIELSENGIPIRLRDNDQGRALTDKWCFGGHCGPERGTRIWLSQETLDRIFVDNFADNALAHEFSHVLSGWGGCSEIDTEGHLEPGHIISNGNTGYGQMSWTPEDTELACSCGACP
jgi:hypothetical protein